MKRRRIMEDNIMRGMLRNWFLPKIYKAYAKDEISVLYLEQLIVKVNLVSVNRYLRDPFFRRIKGNNHSERNHVHSQYIIKCI